MATKRGTQTGTGINRGTRSSRRPGRLYMLISALVIVAAVVLASTVFFQIHTVQAEGCVYTDAQELLQAADIQTGENLFFLNTGKIQETLLEQFSYLKEVNVRRQLPDRVVLEVTERTPIGAVEDGGRIWLVDEEGRVLEEFSRAEFEQVPDVPRITGVPLGEIEVGGVLTPEDDEQDLIEPVLSVLAALEAYDMETQVESLHISSGYEVTFTYGEQFTVKLQMPCDVDGKINFLRQGLERLETQESGCIDLTVDKVFRFIPQSVLDLEQELASQVPDSEEAAQGTEQDGEETEEDDEMAE